MPVIRTHVTAIKILCVHQKPLQCGNGRMSPEQYQQWHQQTFEPDGKIVDVTEKYSIARAQILQNTYHWIG